MFHELKSNIGELRMSATKRKVEIFSAGCSTCKETIELVKRLAGSSHDVEVQHMNRGRNHSAGHGSGNRLHYVRANTACPEDGNQASENGGDRHQLWPEPMHSTLDGRLMNIGVREWAI